MKRLAILFCLLLAGSVFAQGIDRVKTVGTASVQEKRRVRTMLTERIVGKDLIAVEVEKIVGELAVELDQKGYSVKLAFVPTASASGTVTVSVDFMTRRELKVRQASSKPSDGVAMSRRPSRWIPNPGGVIKRIRLRGDEEFCDEHDVFSLLDPIFRGVVLNEESEPRLLKEAQAAVVRLGYPLATVTADDNAYNSRNGQYTIKVDPGRFGDVIVHFGGETNSWFHSNEQVVKKIKGIKKGDVFRVEAINDTMRALNNHPDYRVHAGVEVRGEDTKIGDIVLNVDDSIPIHGNVEVNNYGMHEIGEWQFTGALQLTNLTKHDDILTVSPGLSQNADLWWISGGYLLPFTFWRGGYLNFYGGYSDLKNEEVLTDFDLIGKGWFAGTKLSVNLYDSDRRTVSIDAGVMFRESRDRFDISDLTQYQRAARTLPATIGLVYADKKADQAGGRLWADAQFLFNCYHSGNRLSDYVYGAEDKYYVVSFNVARLQAITDVLSTDVPEWQKWTVFGKIHGSWTDQTLTSSEKLTLGGHDTVRGYRTRGYQGDWGFNGTIEFRTPIWTDPVLKLFMDRKNCLPISRWQFIAFVDAGWMRYNSTEYLASYYLDDEWLASCGLGLRFSLTRYFTLGADFAIPLRKAYLDDQDRDFEFYLSTRMQF